MSDKSAVQGVVDFFNKLPEDLKSKAKHLFSSVKTEQDEEAKKEFNEVKLKAETYIKDNKDPKKVEAVKTALAAAEKDSSKTAELKVLLEEAPATEAYNEAQLEDGTVLKYTGDLAAGAKCVLVTPEGEVPAPEGEHKLADGSIVVIKKEGEDSVISEIKPAAEMKDQAILAAIEKAVEKATKEKFSAFDKENKTLKAELEATKLKLSKKSAQFNDLATVVEAMSKVTSSEPINQPTQTKPNKLSTVYKSRF
jgi:hypothetical protein